MILRYVRDFIDSSMAQVRIPSAPSEFFRQCGAMNPPNIANALTLLSRMAKTEVTGWIRAGLDETPTETVEVVIDLRIVNQLGSR